MTYDLNCPADKDSSFRFDITDDKNLLSILTIAFSHHKSAKAYKVNDGSLVLSWLEPKGISDEWVQFLVPVTAETIYPIVKDWLAQQEYGAEPPYDGSASKGFRVYNERYGQIGDVHHAFVAIKPHWIFYGK